MLRLEIENLQAHEVLGALNDMKDEIKSLKTMLESQQRNQPRSNEPENMTPKEAGAFLRIAYTTVWKWHKTGKIVAYRIGGRLYYKRSELQAVLTNSKTL